MKGCPCLMVLGLTAVALASVGVIGFVHRTALPAREIGGPLACPNCGRTEAGAPVSIGQPVSYGAVHLTNDGTEPAVLEDVTVLDVDPAMELLGTMIVDLGREPAIGLKRGYPPGRAPGTTHLVAGFTLPQTDATHFGVQVLIGSRITANGRHRFRRVAVDYRVRDRRFRALFDASLLLCAPRSMSTSECAGDDF